MGDMHKSNNYFFLLTFLFLKANSRPYQHGTCCILIYLDTVIYFLWPHPKRHSVASFFLFSGRNKTPFPSQKLYIFPLFLKKIPLKIKTKQTSKIECFLPLTISYWKLLCLLCTHNHEYCFWKLFNIPLYLQNNTKFPYLRAPDPSPR